MGLRLEEQLQDCTLLPSSVPVRSQPMENSLLLRFQGVWKEMEEESRDKKLPKPILTIILVCVMPYSHLHRSRIKSIMLQARVEVCPCRQTNGAYQQSK